MESAILSGNSKKDLQLLIALAEKLGIKARILSKEEFEDYHLGKAIEEGETKSYVDTAAFLESL